MQFAGKSPADLQAHAPARSKPGCGQGQALLLVNLAAQPVFDHALDALVEVQIPFGCAPGQIALVQLGAFLLLGCRAGLGRILGGFILMLVGLLLSRQLLGLINTPDEIMKDSQLYLNIYICGLPFVFFYNVATGIFSALGDSKTPFFFLMASSLSNIAVDILFVTAFGMGVDGVAWATFLCQGVSCVLALVFVFRRLAKIHLPEGQRAPVFSGRLLGRVARVAIPSILQQSFVSVGNIVLQSIINSFGTAVMAGYSASVKLNNLVITSLVTLGNGISNFTAQNLGAQKPDRIRSGFRAGLYLVWALCVPPTVLYFFAGAPLVKIFVDNPTQKALATGVQFLHIVAPFYVIVASKIVADGVLRGAGKMGPFMVSTLYSIII